MNMIYFRPFTSICMSCLLPLADFYWHKHDLLFMFSSLCASKDEAAPDSVSTTCCHVTYDVVQGSSYGWIWQPKQRTKKRLEMLEKKFIFDYIYSFKKLICQQSIDPGCLCCTCLYALHSYSGVGGGGVLSMLITTVNMDMLEYVCSWLSEKIDEVFLSYQYQP